MRRGRRLTELGRGALRGADDPLRAHRLDHRPLLGRQVPLVGVVDERQRSWLLARDDVVIAKVGMLWCSTIQSRVNPAASAVWAARSVAAIA